MQNAELNSLKSCLYMKKSRENRERIPLLSLVELRLCHCQDKENSKKYISLFVFYFLINDLSFIQNVAWHYQ